MQHQITTANILHDEVDASLCLETGVQIEQERVSLLVCNQEHSLLGACALDFIVLNNELLLQDLDGVQLLCALGLGKHDLTEVTLSKDCKEVEVVQTYPSASTLRVRWWGNLVLGSFRQS